MSDLREKLEDGRRARAGEAVAPAFGKDAFHCPWCGVFAQQEWVQLAQRSPAPGKQFTTRIHRVTCGNCDQESFWLEGVADKVPPRQLYPLGGAAPAPHPDMPEDVRSDYLEAVAILDRSPRGACAFLRLGLQKLMVDLQETGKDLNADIGRLVQKGLDPQVQQALDALRVIGNNAVHPGELDVGDDPVTAASLFGWLNFIVEQMIARPRKLGSLYAALPPGALAAIEKRDTT